MVEYVGRQGRRRGVDFVNIFHLDEPPVSA